MLSNQVNSDIINLTPAASQAVKSMLAERNLDGYALRIFISDGGCSGLRYGLALDNNFREQDLSCEFDEVKVVIDEVSIEYLRGSTVDFVTTERGTGFAIDNPNPLPSCNCSSSSSQGCSGCG